MTESQHECVQLSVEAMLRGNLQPTDPFIAAHLLVLVVIVILLCHDDFHNDI